MLGQDTAIEPNSFALIEVLDEPKTETIDEPRREAAVGNQGDARVFRQGEEGP